MWSVLSRRRLSSHGLANVVCREATIGWSSTRRLVQLGRQNDLAATAGILGQPAADVLLGDPVTLFDVRRLRAAEYVGGVDEVDAGVRRGVQHGEALRLARLHAEVHGAQPDPADLQTGTAEIAVIHAVLIFAARLLLEADCCSTQTQPHVSVGGSAVRGTGRDSHAPRMAI